MKQEREVKDRGRRVARGEKRIAGPAELEVVSEESRCGCDHILQDGVCHRTASIWASGGWQKTEPSSIWVWGCLLKTLTLRQTVSLTSQLLGMQSKRMSTLSSSLRGLVLTATFLPELGGTLVLSQ